jgi:hypothetical protein
VEKKELMTKIEENNERRKALKSEKRESETVANGLRKTVEELTAWLNNLRSSH